jgi:Uncharacterized protein conserved in bacteria
MQICKFSIFVNIGEQKLYFFEGSELLRSFDISTSRNPPSNQEGSLGTPRGLHKIDGKIGEGLEMDTVFKARKPVGKIHEQSEEDKKTNLIVGRILRLRGLEAGVNSGGNVDTYNRYIYIHGTNQEDKLGTPNSHGCILVGAENLKYLFDAAPDGTRVLIEE